MLALYYTTVIALFGVIPSLNEGLLSNYNKKTHIRILTCLDDSTGKKSEFCFVSKNFVCQNPDVIEKTDYRFEISDP